MSLFYYPTPEPTPEPTLTSSYGNATYAQPVNSIANSLIVMVERQSRLTRATEVIADTLLTQNTIIEGISSVLQNIAMNVSSISESLEHIDSTNINHLKVVESQLKLTERNVNSFQNINNSLELTNKLHSTNNEEITRIRNLFKDIKNLTINKLDVTNNLANSLDSINKTSSYMKDILADNLKLSLNHNVDFRELITNIEDISDGIKNNNVNHSRIANTLESTKDISLDNSIVLQNIGNTFKGIESKLDGLNKSISDNNISSSTVPVILESIDKSISKSSHNTINLINTLNHIPGVLSDISSNLLEGNKINERVKDNLDHMVDSMAKDNDSHRDLVNTVEHMTGTVDDIRTTYMDPIKDTLKKCEQHFLQFVAIEDHRHHDDHIMMKQTSDLQLSAYTDDYRLRNRAFAFNQPNEVDQAYTGQYGMEVINISRTGFYNANKTTVANQQLYEYLNKLEEEKIRAANESM